MRRDDPVVAITTDDAKAIPSYFRLSEIGGLSDVERLQLASGLTVQHGTPPEARITLVPLGCKVGLS